MATSERDEMPTLLSLRQTWAFNPTVNKGKVNALTLKYTTSSYTGFVEEPPPARTE